MLIRIKPLNATTPTLTWAKWMSSPSTSILNPGSFSFNICSCLRQSYSNCQYRTISFIKLIIICQIQVCFAQNICINTSKARHMTNRRHPRAHAAKQFYWVVLWDLSIIVRQPRHGTAQARSHEWRNLLRYIKIFYINYLCAADSSNTQWPLSESLNVIIMRLTYLIRLADNKRTATKGKRIVVLLGKKIFKLEEQMLRIQFRSAGQNYMVELTFSHPLYLHHEQRWQINFLHSQKFFVSRRIHSVSKPWNHTQQRHYIAHNPHCI
jgi:hypothetical protein